MRKSSYRELLGGMKSAEKSQTMWTTSRTWSKTLYLLMQAAGMTSMQIIVAATRNAARVCELDRELGTIEVGKITDVWVVNGAPLQDLRALAQVRLVIHNSVVIRD